MNFTCAADGLPEPSLVWLRDEALLIEVPGRVEVSVCTQPAFRLSVSDAEVLVSTVTLHDVKSSDNNTELYCVAENGFGEPAILDPPYKLIIASIQGVGKLHGFSRQTSFLNLCFPFLSFAHRFMCK